ncbi:MAG: hypothetical protein IKN87_04865 [Bacilli bacterium]|nr:hypothetical protein [Bacilli bacterium]
MSASIFDVEIRININKEYIKMIKYLHELDDTTESGDCCFSFIDAIDNYAFSKWPYRGTAINCIEYLQNIGLPDYLFKDCYSIDMQSFLYYIEFIYNIYKFATLNDYIYISDASVCAILDNIDLIVEKLNYQFIEDKDRFILVKRDSDVDSILNNVDSNIALTLLEYNDFKVKYNIKRKNELLKTIDNYIEKKQSIYLKLDKDTYKSIGYIMNNFGINHKINEKYKNITESEILQWYDKCFKLCIHLIRKEDINRINIERKKLEE